MAVACRYFNLPGIDLALQFIREPTLQNQPKKLQVRSMNCRLRFFNPCLIIHFLQLAA